MLQPASVDLKLGSSFRVFHNHRIQTIDIAAPPRDLTEHVTLTASEPFVIHPGEFVLGSTAERVTLPADIVARIEGKALALDTRVPTPQGWRTMGEIRVGDYVFDPSGKPVSVVAATAPMTNRPCRELLFSDGTSIVSDVSHQWEVQSKYDRRRGDRYRVLTTEEIERTNRCSWAPDENAYHVPLAAAVEYPAKRLPIDPYVLGSWLGDGTTTQAVLTCADQPILEEIALAGYGVRATGRPLAYRIGGAGHTRDPLTGRYARNDSMSSQLRNLGLLGHKRIPRLYLEGSVSQRRALLAGLMDTDGYVDTRGRCDLTTVKPDLAEDYRELIASLGNRPIIAEKRAILDGRDCGPKYEVTFTPRDVVFRLPRKVGRQDPEKPRHRSRAITAVRPVESVPVRCIEVAAARGAYLVSDAFITTHNSSLGRLGLIVHATAGFVDPGFEGTLTLEITNFNGVPIVLRLGLPIAQLSFMALDKAAERPYGHPELGSHYHGQIEATESRYEGGPGARDPLNRAHDAAGGSSTGDPSP